MRSLATRGIGGDFGGGGAVAGPAALATRVGGWLFLGGIALYLLLSPQSLFYVGILYEAPGGSPLEKLHPANWLVLLATAVLMLARGNPLRVGGRLLAAEPLLAAYLACMLFVLGWSLARHGASGAASIVDTLILPFFCVAALGLLDAQRRYQCLKLIVFVLAVNAVLAIVETMLQTKLIPLRIGGGPETVEEIFRPSALLGHPLNNSMITATLLPVVLYLRIAMAWRVVLMLLLWVGLLSFGGRTGFLLATLAYGLYFLGQITLAALRGRFSYLQLSGGALLGCLAAALLAAAIASSGIGDRIFKTLEWDSSASVRVQIWSVFDYLSDFDMLMGLSLKEITAVGFRMGLTETEAIENFWLMMFLQTGWIGFVPFVVAMACVIAWLWRSSGGAMRVALLLFLAIGSSNNSLATKTIVLLLFMVVVAIVRRQPIPD